jgi:hypothetical protein
MFLLPKNNAQSAYGCTYTSKGGNLYEVGHIRLFGAGTRLGIGEHGTSIEEKSQPQPDRKDRNPDIFSA